MNTSVKNNSESVNSRVSNIIRAELVTIHSGEALWKVWRQQGDTASDEFYFREAIKARRYVNILKKQGGGWMPKEDFNALCQAMKATPRQHFEVTATAEDGQPCSTIVAAKVPSDAERIGRARIARLWGPEAKAMKYAIQTVMMPEPEAPKAAKPKRRRSTKKATNTAVLA